MAVHRFKRGDRRPQRSDRRTGRTSAVTRPVKDFLRALVDDPEVQESIRRQIIEGKPGAMEAFLEAAQMVMGRPRRQVEVSTSPDLAQLLALAHELRHEEEGRLSRPSSAA